MWLDTDEAPDVPVPAGGATGQILRKTSNADYAAAWQDVVISSATAPADTRAFWYNTENGNAYIYYDSFWASVSGAAGVPLGGTAGQVLAKTSSTDYATQWVAPSALTLLAQQTFTAATSIIIDNVFSATYNSYQIVVSATSSAASAVLLNYRVGGVNAATNYNSNTVAVSGATGFTASSLAATAARIGRWDTTGGLCTATIHGVALPQRTYGVALSTDSSISTELSGHNHTTATAYDGFRVVVPSSTGEIRVYGMRN